MIFVRIHTEIGGSVHGDDPVPRGGSGRSTGRGCGLTPPLAVWVQVTIGSWAGHPADPHAPPIQHGLVFQLTLMTHHCLQELVH